MEIYKQIMVSFILLMLVFGNINKAVSQPNYPRDAEQANLIYSDIENFVEAYDQLKHGVDTIAVLNEFYFDKASTGLNEYITRHQLTPILIRSAIRENPAKYEQVSNFVNSIDDLKPKFIDKLKKFDNILPNAMYAPTYLLVGANRGIAQASKYGQLVTITRVIDDEEKLMKLIIHELSHFQQAMSIGGEKYVALYSEPNNMLELCLREGGAEFITSLVLKEITQEKALIYLNKNESELKLKFIKDLKVQDKGFWLWESINQKEYPILLGYAMGYKICKSLYKKAPNKNEAIKKILRIDDANQFLNLSGYFVDND